MKYFSFRVVEWSVFGIIVNIAPIYLRMSENHPVDNINRIENLCSQKLSCQIWQLAKLLISADLHPSLDELLGKLTVSIKVNKFQNFSDINIYHCTNPGLRREKKKGNLTYFLYTSKNGKYIYTKFRERRLLSYIYVTIKQLWWGFILIYHHMKRNVNKDVK